MSWGHKDKTRFGIACNAGLLQGIKLYIARVDLLKSTEVPAGRLGHGIYTRSCGDLHIGREGLRQPLCLFVYHVYIPHVYLCESENSMT